MDPTALPWKVPSDAGPHEDMSAAELEGPVNSNPLDYFFSFSQSLSLIPGTPLPVATKGQNPLRLFPVRRSQWLCVIWYSCRRHSRLGTGEMGRPNQSSIWRIRRML
ncbi:hypothetical protein FQA47_017365 [Oryzias melastigma]|uniref:Uncharacterized protein n=1 Tax=Oryzias melastigma TaxID=30732 RepID=A0A834BSR3_ORYME|nr:hypothetical protein FQA47_017365 [Oryzias melastigma]